jgi:4-hydroxyphenylpyruvate dioxygenase
MPTPTGAPHSICPSKSTTAAAIDQAITGIDHIRMQVGNARQTTHLLSSAFGMTLRAYRGPEQGSRDHAEYLLEAGRVRLRITGPAAPGAAAADWAQSHGDSVSDIALATYDVDRLYAHATANGARGYDAPRDHTDEHGTVRAASIATYGELRHTFIDRTRYRGAFLPGFVAMEPLSGQAPPVFESIDHTVGCVGEGELDTWVQFYETTLGFTKFAAFTSADISTQYSALMSTVVADGTGRIKLPLNEAAPGLRRSQIDEFLEYHHGPGVQHIALNTPDILASVDVLRARGITFLPTPPAYYDDPALADRVGDIRVSTSELRRRGILVDRDEDGYLLQIFTTPLLDRPTMFIELIERNGATGFGTGNFKALFEAVEREPARRGNL